MALASSSPAAAIIAAAPACTPAAARSSSSTQSLPSTFKVCFFQFMNIFLHIHANQ
uniref:Uncharacterized protein n=1 Tax=Picea sitchensis TaxID=3332 RepID=A9P1B8_PICSI|nr:unknown [Picea sitchensis]